MGTTYETIYNSFKMLIVQDKTLITDGIPEEMLEERWYGLLCNAIGEMYTIKDNKDMPLNFYEEMNNETKQFNIVLNSMEISLISKFMYQCYLAEQGIDKVNAMRACGFSDDDIKQFSTAEILNQFIKMETQVKQSNINALYQYKRMDRKTLNYKRLDYSTLA